MFDPNSPDTILRMAPKMDAQQLAQMAKQHAKSPNGALWAGFAMAAQKRQQTAQAAQPPAPTVAAQLGFDPALPEDRGIAQLPAPNMQFADGGVVGLAGGGAPSFEEALRAEGVTDPKEIAFLKAIYGQESGSGRNTATSNRGAVGHMQILPGTFKSVADPGWDIGNPEHNMRGGIRYARQGLQAAEGDPRLGATYYYGGPGGLAAARKSEPRYDTENARAPNTLQYADQVVRRMGPGWAERLTDALPIGAANAAQVPQAPQAQSAVNRIPGMERAVDPTTGATPDRSVGDRVVGGLEALANATTGALSTPLVYGNALLHGLTARAAGLPMDEATREAESAAARVAGRTVYTPRTEAGEESAQGLQRALRDMKIPPYIPAMPVGSPRMPSTAQAQSAGARAAQAQSALTGPVANTPAAQLAAAARGATFADEAAAAAHAAVQAERVRSLMGAGAGVQSRLGAGAAAATAALGATAAGRAPIPPADDAAARDASVGFGARGAAQARQGEFDAQTAAPDRATAIAAAQKAIPPEKRKGWTDDMLMMFFLQMMAGTSRSALQNVGNAGMQAMQYGMAAKKADREDRVNAANERLINARIRAADAGLGAERNDITALRAELSSVDNEIKRLSDPMAKFENPNAPAQLAQLQAQRDAIRAKLRSVSSTPAIPAPIQAILEQYGGTQPNPE